ncbi:MAG: hypothetical protein JWQ40_5199 [Segetibacter sp.]|jgi:hypothetical protein|nr:hypothetical protein [Segetibacter sp.]
MQNYLVLKFMPDSFVAINVLFSVSPFFVNQFLRAFGSTLRFVMTTEQAVQVSDTTMLNNDLIAGHKKEKPAPDVF